MDEYLKKDFGKILKKAGLDGHRYMKNTDSTVCRIYDRNLEELNLTVDLYDKWARIVDYSSSGLADEEKEEVIDIVSRFLYVERNKIVYVYRKKREKGEQHEKNDDSCPVSVKENGILFECELKKYADTGLFLDQAETRKLVRDMSSNERVLNLFCYTSSFSLYAAMGNAETVTSVDLSNVYCSWSRRNFINNGFLDEEKYKIVTKDVREFLCEEREKKGSLYDLVILDPPAFSNSHKAEDFDVQKDHTYLLTSIYDILSEGGVVLFSENLQGFVLDRNKISLMYEIEEITESVFALNFSHKRKSCRVWLLKKIDKKKRERKERKMDEKIERLSIEEEPRKRRREGKNAPREFKFEEREEKVEKRSSSYTRDRENERKSNRYTEDRNSYSDRRENKRYRDNDNYKKRSYRDDERSNDRSRFSEDRRDYRERNREEGRSRYSDENRERYRNEGRDRYRERRYEGEGSFSRRDGDIRRNSRDNRDNRWENDTSRYYRSERRYSNRNREEESTETRRSERKKRTAPKPFGYDSFMNNKKREGITGSWIINQEVSEKKD